MPGDFPRQVPQLTIEQFHALRDERPEGERWELIDGVPMMMPPPTLVHQRIAGNIDRLLNDRLRRTKPEWRADREIGLLLAEDEHYNPEPDVTVIDATVRLEQVYAERFYFVAEVLSPGDKQGVLAAKMSYYRSHGPCVGVLFVRQDCLEAELYLRSRKFDSERLTAPGDHVVIDEIGDIGSLGMLYRDTPLHPGQSN